MKPRTAYLATAAYLAVASWLLILSLALFPDHTPDAPNIPMVELAILNILTTIASPVTVFIHRQPESPTELMFMAICTGVVAPLIWAMPVFIVTWGGNLVQNKRSAEQPPA